MVGRLMARRPLSANWRAPSKEAAGHRLLWLALCQTILDIWTRSAHTGRVWAEAASASGESAS